MVPIPALYLNMEEYPSEYERIVALSNHLRSIRTRTQDVFYGLALRIVQDPQPHIDALIKSGVLDPSSRALCVRAGRSGQAKERADD